MINDYMVSGLYTLTKNLKPHNLIARGHYRRKKEGRFFWHMITLDMPILLEAGKPYGVIFRMKANGLLHSVSVKPHKEILAESFSFRNRY